MKAPPPRAPAAVAATARTPGAADKPAAGAKMLCGYGRGVSSTSTTTRRTRQKEKKEQDRQKIYRMRKELPEVRLRPADRPATPSDLLRLPC